MNFFKNKAFLALILLTAFNLKAMNNITGNLMVQNNTGDTITIIGFGLKGYDCQKGNLPLIINPNTSNGIDYSFSPSLGGTIFGSTSSIPCGVNPANSNTNFITYKTSSPPTNGQPNTITFDDASSLANLGAGLLLQFYWSGLGYAKLYYGMFNNYTNPLKCTGYPFGDALPSVFDCTTPINMVKPETYTAPAPASTAPVTTTLTATPVTTTTTPPVTSTATPPVVTTTTPPVVSTVKPVVTTTTVTPVVSTVKPVATPSTVTPIVTTVKPVATTSTVAPVVTTTKPATTVTTSAAAPVTQVAAASGTALAKAKTCYLGNQKVAGGFPANLCASSNVKIAAWNKKTKTCTVALKNPGKVVNVPAAQAACTKAKVFRLK